METSFQKIQNEPSLYIPTTHWSHKNYALIYTQTRGTTTMYNVSNTTLLNRMQNFRLSWENAFFNANYLKDLFENINLGGILSF